MTRPKTPDAPQPSAGSSPTEELVPHPTLRRFDHLHPCWNTAYHRLERTPRLTSPPWNSQTSTDVLSSKPPTTLVDEWLDRPISPLACALGWCAGFIGFVGIIRLLGGPSRGDFEFLVYSIWAIEHGQFGCAFPSPDTTSDPFYPLFSGGVAALASIGHSVPFPPRSALGPHCDRAMYAIEPWAVQADAGHGTFEIGYLSILPLLAGVVAVLRTIGRGQRRWEPAMVVTVALLPPVWMCVESTFHPEDLFAMGFALLAIACARRTAWAWAGFWISLALVAQPFAVLVATPLLVLAPACRRLRFVGSALICLAVLLLPLAVVGSEQTKGGLLHQLQTGIQNGSTAVLVSGTVVWELHLSGTWLVLVSRVLPIALAFFLAWWVVRRLGEKSLEPVVLLSLIAVCLGLRLVFEETLFGYYFMALTVALVLVDVARGHIRFATVAWITVVSFVFGVMSQPVHVFNGSWADTAQNVTAVVILVGALSLLARSLLRRKTSDALVCVAVLAATLLAWDVSANPFGCDLPVWFWQTALVLPGLVLAAKPLVREVMGSGTPTDSSAGPATDLVRSSTHEN